VSENRDVHADGARATTTEIDSVEIDGNLKRAIGFEDFETFPNRMFLKTRGPRSQSLSP